MRTASYKSKTLSGLNLADLTFKVIFWVISTQLPSTALQWACALRALWFHHRPQTWTERTYQLLSNSRWWKQVCSYSQAGFQTVFFWIICSQREVEGVHHRVLHGEFESPAVLLWGLWGRTYRGNDPNWSVCQGLWHLRALWKQRRFLATQTRSSLTTWKICQNYPPSCLVCFLKMRIKFKGEWFYRLEEILQCICMWPSAWGT